MIRRYSDSFGARLRRRMLAPLALAALLLVLAGCGGSSADGYGGAKNHIHDLVALSGAPNTLLVASHIGLYRTADGGKTWSEVAGGAGQAMDGLMIYKLAQSPVEPQRVYALAGYRPDDKAAAKGELGVYLSDDAGQTWKLVAPLSAFPNSALFTIAAGAGSAGQVFAVVPNVGAKGLYMSDDAGAHWRQQPDLPTDSTNGLVADPGKAGRLWAYSASSGLYSTDDNGAHWKKAPGVRGGVFSVAVAAQTVYAAGDGSLFVSKDDGASFTSASGDITFSTVAASAKDPATAYALTGTAVYVSGDTGASWKQTGPISRQPSYLTVDPASATTAYAGASYPIAVAATSDGGARWSVVLP
jgi:BNR/Asp-box repeat